MQNKLEFANVSINIDAFELRVDDKPVAVEPLVLELIIEMAQRPGFLRTREDLIDTVWNGRIVSDTTISTAIKSARKVLGDTGVEKRLIRTIRGRGFQFIAELLDSSAHKNVTASNSPELPVLRVQVTALDDSISPSLVRALEGSLRSFFDKAPFLNIAAPSATIEPTHILEVALSSIDTATYADTSLSEVRTGLQYWARHFSMKKGAGIDELIVEIGPKAEPQILRAASEFLAARNDDEPRALVLSAMRTISENGLNPTSITAANDLLNRAIAKNDSIPLAFAFKSLLNAIGFRVGMLRHDNSVVSETIESAERALALNSQSSAILGLAGCALCDVGQLARGEPILDRAIELDPMNGHAHAAKGAALMMRKEFEAALVPLRRSFEISPADSRLAVWGAVLAMAELRCGQLDKAKGNVEKAVSRDDHNYLPRLAALAVYLAQKDDTSFNRALSELLRVHPKITSDEVLFFVGSRAHDVIWPRIIAAQV